MRLLLAAFLLLIVPLPALAKNVALVIGNSAYRNVEPLANPANDAIAVSNALTAQGFQVVMANNLTRSEMYNTLIGFRSLADAADIAVVYYAGHGIEIAGQNFLIPVDASARDARDAHVEMVQVADLLPQISGARRLKMVVLDACRNNPFVAQMKSAGQDRGVGRGLAIVESAEADTLIAYAAAAGAVTPDGAEGGNSPFTSAFLRALDGPPTDIRLLLGSVRDEMRQTVPGAAPFVYSSLGKDRVVINPNSAGSDGEDGAGDAGGAAAVAGKFDPNAMIVDFATAEIADSPDLWLAFLEKYKDHADQTLYVLARRKQAQIENRERLAALQPVAPPVTPDSVAGTAKAAPPPQSPPDAPEPVAKAEPGAAPEPAPEAVTLADPKPEPAVPSVPEAAAGPALEPAAPAPAAARAEIAFLTPAPAAAPEEGAAGPDVGIAFLEPEPQPDLRRRTLETGPAVNPPAPEPVLLGAGAAARAIQTLLRDAGCYPGLIDGDLGRRSQAGLDRFASLAGISVALDREAGAERLNEVLSLLRAHDGVECPAAPVVQKTAPAPRRTAPAPRRTAPAPAAPARDKPCPSYGFAPGCPNNY
ncbi:MAG: caspase family protein [Rhodobacteraceae bacterium]|nr:caspase family protein [Paracoccaceae bacterium]